MGIGAQKRDIELPKKKVGLALGSGAARGLAHIGVLQILEREHIPIDMIAGTSAGALIGALYACGENANRLDKLVTELVSRRFSLLADLALPKTGLFKGKKIKDQLRSIIGDIEFEDLRIPFACVAADLMTGEEVVIKHGPVVEGVRASVSLPAIFAVVKWEERYLVDGGLVNPVPVHVLREMGADFVIAVNVIPDLVHRMHEVSEKQIGEPREPNMLNIMVRMVHIAAYQAVKASLAGADVVIEPDVSHIGFGDFRKIGECIARGELAARTAIAEIRGKL